MHINAAVQDALSMIDYQFENHCALYLKFGLGQDPPGSLPVPGLHAATRHHWPGRVAGWHPLPNGCLLWPPANQAGTHLAVLLFQHLSLRLRVPMQHHAYHVQGSAALKQNELDLLPLGTHHGEVSLCCWHCPANVLL